jgi:aminoglycoside phosphotransferase (APT) family kinase protein
MADDADVVVQSTPPAAPLIDAAALLEWLRGNVDGSPPFSVTRMGEGTGVANALFDVTWGGRRYVLRRPPAAKITASAGDTMRERRLLAALAGTDVRHPRLVGACEDASVIGAPFILMERIDGFTPIDPLPSPFDQDRSARHALGIELVDALAELALVDWEAVGLEGFGKPGGFLARQVDRWLWQLDSYRSREIPDVDAVSEWLRANRPEPGPIGVMHGDYSLFNVMFSHGAPAHLAAIVDWDTATIGETLMDLGHVLARWDDEGEEPTVLGSADNPDRSGLASRAELAARYQARTGCDVTNLRYYEVLSLFKLGCIMEGHYASAVAHGDRSGGRFSTLSIDIIRDAARIARGERP